MYTFKIMDKIILDTLDHIFILHHNDQFGGGHHERKASELEKKQ
ncbi:hypothetical protein LEMLEM_LOCUS9036, partial [Lemmus lemmus]